MARTSTRWTPEAGGPLSDAARQALHAPSVFNTQPWRWRVDRTGGSDDGVLELRADLARALPVTDPDRRLLMISCGAALHHARVALAAAGYQAEVARFPEPADPELLARIRIIGAYRPTERDRALAAAIPRRRTDRRAFADTPVPPDAMRRLAAAVSAEGVGLHQVRPDQMPMLAVVTAQAAAAELADPAYRAELTSWTHRPGGPGTACRRRWPSSRRRGGCRSGITRWAPSRDSRSVPGSTAAPATRCCSAPATTGQAGWRPARDSPRCCSARSWRGCPPRRCRTPSNAPGRAG
ncbi:hypothetical protein [Plantactinospora sp. KBS50]|uniref:Acg family FMN-binding oxidoreductase n=1 Tax=Plantactinospora sp. KBS50 TaxID=2024580 RepID=UPI001E2C9E9F|nr:hypothetical protein [Plantactinospora sp. KBS50]